MKNKDLINKCILYINENCDEVCEYVNIIFEQNKEYIKQSIIKKIQKYLKGDIIHYEWYYDGCPYDFSGDLRKNGKIDLEQNIFDFLENEYTGGWEATYTSHNGKNYITYGKDLSYTTLELADSILRSSVKELLEKHFMAKLSKDEFEYIMDETFDDIYCDSIAYDFFLWGTPIAFCDLEKTKLNDVIKMDF